MTREEVKKEMDRRWLRDWGDMLALACIILCLLELATRASVAFGKGLRLASYAVKHYLDNRRHQRRPAWAWEQRPVEPMPQKKLRRRYYSSSYQHFTSGQNKLKESD
ncbi:MAG: hypothetical protein GY696_19585 [Gammaproteobacteria bacterium]|nr:hypothetical protein [Gammaproteobacteria bacterium]